MQRTGHPNPQAWPLWFFRFAGWRLVSWLCPKAGTPQSIRLGLYNQIRKMSLFIIAGKALYQLQMVLACYQWEYTNTHNTTCCVRCKPV